jgi:myosin V
MLNIVTGSHIWVEDKDLSRVDGEVFQIDGQNAHVRTTKGEGGMCCSAFEVCHTPV